MRGSVLSDLKMICVDTTVPDDNIFTVLFCLMRTYSSPTTSTHIYHGLEKSGKPLHVKESDHSFVKAFTAVHIVKAARVDVGRRHPDITVLLRRSVGVDWTLTNAVIENGLP